MTPRQEPRHAVREIIPVTDEAGFQSLLRRERALLFIFVPWASTARVSRVRMLGLVGRPDLPVELFQVDADDHPEMIAWLGEQGVRQLGGNGELFWLRQGSVVDEEGRPDQFRVETLARRSVRAFQTTYDEVLVNPSGEELRAGVNAAAAALEPCPPFLSLPRFEVPGMSTPSGFHEEYVCDVRETWGDVEEPTSHFRLAVGWAWWTDAIGRRHVRIVGRRRSWLFGGKTAALFTARPEEQHPLALVYPSRIRLRLGSRRAPTVACCPYCGEEGPPEALHWMGPSCGPCHDRIEEGILPAIMPPETPAT